MMKSKIIFSVAALLCFLVGHTQNITNKGMEFWVGYGHHQYMEANCDGTGNPINTMNMVLYLSAEEATTVVVTLDSSSVGPFANSAYSRTYTLAANQVIATEIIPKGTENAVPSGTNPNYDARLITDPPPAGSGGEGIFRKKGIHIVSLNKPIVAYAHIYGSVASGATMLMPVTAWGYNYTSMNSEQTNASMSYSWMYVIAKENNTVVRITPSVTTRLGKQANQSFDVPLQKGQIYQLVGQSDCATGNGPELTGTTVKSIAGPDGECHAVAVFSGSSRTQGEISTCPGGGRDNDMQQLFPEQTWGKRYLTAPFSAASGATINANQFQTSVYKVLVRDPTTVVMKNGVQLTGLIKNKYYKFSSNTTDSIIADKPIMVGQFMSGGSCNPGSSGDPEMVYLSPVEQAIKRIGFFRNTREVITVNYLTLIVPTKGVPSLRIDGSSSFSHTYPHATPGYTVVVKGWPAAQAQCIVTCDSAFTGITYGLGGAESYAYNAGTYLNNLNGLPDMHNVSDTTNQGNNSHLFTCNGSPVELSVLVRYQLTKMVWKLSDLGFDIMPNLDVTVDPASTAYKGTVMVNGLLYYKYTLPGTYTFNKTGSFYVRTLCTSPSLTEHCNNTEEFYLNFEVKAAPTADFTFSNPTDCVKDTTFFFGPKSTGMSDAQQWSWTFPDGLVGHHQDTSYVFKTAGNNEVVLRAVTQEGCIAKVTKQINVKPVPAGSVTVNPPFVCEGNSVELTTAASYTGAAPVNSYYWNLGNGTELKSATPDLQTVLYNQPGEYKVKMVAGISKLCVSDTVPATVTIYSKPKVQIAYPEGCLPANGVVTFTNTTTVTDGQSITSHAWDFGDAVAATPANPNTSVAESPSHTYTAFGDYNITYSVTSSKGCVKDSVIKATFSVLPVIDYPATLAPVCEKDASLSIAIATVTNAVPGKFSYTGPGVDAQGMFNPAVAGPGVHDIIASFTSTTNCTVTKTTRITVNANPVAAFTVPAGGCLPAGGQVVFDNTSSISTGATLTWVWNFNDPNATGSDNTSTAFEPSHQFSDGTYDISLKATAPSGCFSEIVHKTVLSVMPVVDYPSLPSVCESATPYSIATATVNGSIISGGTYSGKGVSADGLFDPVKAGAGTHEVTYIYTTAGGCKAEDKSSVVVRPRPFASFEEPKGCLPSTGALKFSNNSTISSGETLTWSWNFGDAAATTGNENVSTLFEPTHRFKDGDYTITLRATSASGCFKDTVFTAKIGVSPVVDYPALTAVCESAAAYSIATATVNGIIVSGGTYSGKGVTAAGSFNPATAGAGTHEITYAYTTAGGCSAQDKTSIQVLARPLSSFTVNKKEICLGEKITITPGSQTGVTWNWTFGDGTKRTTTGNSAFDAPAATTANPYKIEVTTVNSQSCTSALTTEIVNIHPLPVADFTVPTKICVPGTATFLNKSTVADNSTLTYVWNFNNAPAVVTGDKDPIRNFNSTGYYTATVTATSAYGCKDVSDTKQVTDLFQRPTANFTISPAEICQGQDVTFTDASTPAGSITTRSWSFSDGMGETKQSFTRKFNDAGQYTVSVTATNAAGCSAVSTPKTVTVHVQPQIDAGRSFTALAGTLVQFEATANSQVLSFSWSPAAGLLNANSLKPSLVVTEDATYTLTATGEHNCTASDQLTIAVLKTVVIPNAFSPNGDNNNDRWLIPNLSDYPASSVQVFNRYGQQVLSLKGYGTPWDGKFNGKDLPMGTYYYIIKLGDGSAPMTGSVTIVR